MYVYDLIAIILIAISHVYLYLNLIKYKQMSWRLLTTISVIFTILLMIIVTATGFPEFNALLLLTFLLSLGLLQQKHGLTFAENLFYALFSLVIITIYRMILIEIIFYLFMLSPFNLYRWTGSVIHLISTLIIFMTLIISRKQIVRATRFITQSKLYNMTYTLLTVTFFILLALTTFSTNMLNPSHATYSQIGYLISIVLFLLLLIIFVISSHLSRVKLEEDQQEQLDNVLLDYTEKLEVMHDELTSFRHDYINILLSLDSAIRNENIDEIERIYFNTIAPTSKIINNKELDLFKLSKININEVKSVITVKTIEAQQKNIKIIIDIPEEINDINMPVIPFIRAISIILDNAIEEAEHSTNRKVAIAFFEIDGTQSFIVRNSSTETELDLQSLYEKHYTMKGSNRGIGLFSLKRLIEQFPHVVLETEFDNTFFTQKLTLRAIHDHS